MDLAIKQSIVRRLDFARIELSDLRQYQGVRYSDFNSDRPLRRNVERMIENICNSMVDIGKIILAQYDIEMPDTYGDVFIKLEVVGFIDRPLSVTLAQATKLRNVLAHQYLDIKWKYIEQFLQRDYRQVEEFLGQVERWIIQTTLR